MIGGSMGEALDPAGQFGGGGLEALTGNRAKNASIEAQTRAADQANQTQKNMYDTTRADQAFYREAGNNAIKAMENPELHRNFGAGDFQADPGYQFRLDEGQKALERSAAARGGLNSGATLKALSRFNQDTASNEYQNAYNRFTGDQDRRFGRLSTLANFGQGANQITGNAGTGYANQVSQNQIGVGNATAAATMGASGRMSQMMGQGVGAVGAMFSDERLKTNITPISDVDLSELKSVIKPYMFNYANDLHGKGDWVGVMAQDLQKTKLGRTLVFEDEQGRKQIDMRKVGSLILATMAGD